MNISAFPIPIKVDKLEPSVNNESLLMDINHLLKNSESCKRSGVNIYQSDFGLEKKYESFFNLKKQLSIPTKEYTKWSGVISEVDCFDFWVNVNSTPWAYHMPHVHSFTKGLFSGVYFPKTLKSKQDDVLYKIQEHPDPGSLVLMDPNRDVKTGMSYHQKVQLHPFFGSCYCITPKEYVYVLFPNYLQHIVTPTESDNIRISIGFNIKII